MTTEYKITKSNYLIEASYKLTLNEQRLVLAAIAKIDPRKPLPRGGIKISAAEFGESFDIDKGYAYEALREGAERLYDRSITKIQGAMRDDMRWIDRKATYYEGDAYVILYFTQHIAPYLTLLHKKFTSYEMKKIAGLRSVYAIRLYEMFMRFKDNGEFVINLDEFKERLALGDKYKRWHDVRKRVIETAVQELEERVDLDIEWTPIKKGRAVVRLSFSFGPSEQMRLKFGNEAAA